jgi:hypothetical protein
MNKRKAIWTAVFLAVVVVLCVAGTKVSRITQTTTIQGDSLFLVVTGSQSAGTLQSRSIEASNLLSQLTNFPGWPAGGSATNAITTLKTNGTSVSAAATTLNLIAGTNVVLNATNTAGVVDVRINAAGDLNALTNVDAGAVVFLDTGGNDTTARRGRIDKPALTASNAQALAQSGDQIFVRPGLYNLGTNRLALRSNVKWYFEPGARFAMLDAANPDGIAMFHDHGGAATNCGIYGYGQFFQTNTYGPVLHMTNLASSVTFDAQDCYMLQVGQDAAIKRVGGDLILNIKGTLKAVYDTYLDEPNFSIASNKVVAYVQNIEAHNSIIETAKPFRNQGDFYFKFGHATRLAGSGVVGGGEGGIEGTDNCVIEGGTVFLDGDGSKIVGNGSGGEPFIFRNAVVTVVSTNRTPAVGYMSSGEGGSRLHLQNVFLNAQTPVDPVMIHTNGGFTIEDSTILAGASSTNAIRATNAQNVKLLGSVRYNKPLSANVTIVEHSSTMTNRLHRTHITGTLQTDSVIASADVTATAGLYGATGDVTADFNVGGVLVSGFVFPANSTANRALATDAAGYATNSAATMTELGYLSGVGGAIQTQLNSATNRIETKQAGAAALSNIVASGFALPYITIATNGGANNSVTQLVVRTATGMVVSNDASGIASLHISAGGAGDVTAAASFSTDNRVIRSDGTGKGVQVSAIGIDDSGNLQVNAGIITRTNGSAFSYINDNGVFGDNAGTFQVGNFNGPFLDYIPSTMAIEPSGTQGILFGTSTKPFGQVAATNIIGKATVVTPALTVSNKMVIPWVAKTNDANAAATINASSGLNQYANLGVATNLTFVPLAGADASNSVPIRVTFTQNSVGTWPVTINGAALGIDTNALSSTDVIVWIQNGATNAQISIPFKTSVAAKGDRLIYDGTNWINLRPSGNGLVLYSTNAGPGGYFASPTVVTNDGLTNGTVVGLVNGAGVAIKTISAGLNIILTNNGTNLVIASSGSGSTPTTTRGDMIYRGASADDRLPIGSLGAFLMSDGTDPVWRRGSDMNIVREDFYYQQTSDPILGFGWLKAGALATTTSEFGDENHWGVIRTRGPSTVRTHAGLYMNPQCMILSSNSMFLEWIVKVSPLSSAGRNYSLIVGLADDDSTATNVVDGMFSHYNHGFNSGKWQSITSSNSVRTTNNAAPAGPSDNTWVKLGIHYANTNAVFYVNGASVATNALNIPLGAGRATGPWATVAPHDSLAVDIEFYQDFYGHASRSPR